MTDFADFLVEVKDWVNRPDLSDTVAIRWVRFAESRMNNEIRCKEMLHQATNVLTANKVTLPADCTDLTYVKYASGKPLKVVTMDEFWEVSVDPSHEWYRKPIFCRHGNSILVNPNVNATDGTSFEIGYYGKVEPFTVNATPLYLSNPRLYFYATLASSAAYLVEDERMPTWEAQATAVIQSINDAHKTEKFSGSPLHLRKRSFG